MIYQVLETDYNNRVGINFNTHSYEYGYRTSFFEFDEDGYIEYDGNDIVENDGKYVYIGNKTPTHIDLFFDWENVDVIITELVDENYDRLKFSLQSTHHHFSEIWVKKKDGEAIRIFYENRNRERKEQSQRIYSYLDENILDMAENLVNIIEEDVMLNWRIVHACHECFSHLVSLNNVRHGSKYGNAQYLRIDTTGTKGKKKIEIEKQSAKLQQQYRNFTEIVKNFVELIMEEKGVKLYVAKAVAWEAIQIKIIEYYGQIWQNKYDTQLEIGFDELYEQSSNKKDVAKEYIEQVLLSKEIDGESVKEILMYFLLYKNDRVIGFNLPKMFDSFYEKFRAIKEGLNAQDIKSKLKTKQVRKINKYTIDDIDIMTGAEFEEFVGLLFKKMGYSSQVTKQSGDQGLDVIATKNGTKIGIQAKCYSNTVGNSAVQEAVAGKSFYNCDKVIVITNNFFTPAAIELAQSNGVILWNRDMLKEKLKELM